jgi:hypothetical protein
MATSFSGGRSRREPPTIGKQLVVKFSFGPEYFSVRHQFVSNFIRLRYTYLSKRFSGDINACLKGIVLPAYI